MKPTGDSRRATRATARALLERTLVEGSTRTERNTERERPGAWALQGRARDGLKGEPEAKERAGAIDDRRLERRAAEGAKRRGAGFDEVKPT